MTHFDPLAFLVGFAVTALLCALVGAVLALCWAACEGER